MTDHLARAISGRCAGLAHTSAVSDPMLRPLPSGLLFAGMALVALWLVMMRSCATCGKRSTAASPGWRRGVESARARS